jgi:translation initiation factor IF-2
MQNKPSKEADKNATVGQSKPPQRAAAPKVVRIPGAITVAQLAVLLDASSIDVMKHLMRAGIMANINQAIDFETASAVAPLFGYRAAPLEKAPRGPKNAGNDEEESKDLLKTRPPIVTILGHVDHGKTTLLDTIRKTKVAEQEAGGITQRIGAYQTEYNNSIISFLDTPGHEAFTAMRARGTDATDVAVLVVAADDGVMPQTVEAINHVKEANVPIVVAINKTDLPDADIDRVHRQLSENGLLIEAWGGDVIAVPVSAKIGEGVDDLLENILVVAEIADLKANPDRAAKGVVIEANLDKSRGPVATVLVKTGTLHVGDYLLAGSAWGRVKALIDYRGQRIRMATPSMPAEVLGLSQLPSAGDSFQVVSSDKEARTLAEESQRQRESRLRMSLNEVFNRIRAGESKELNLVIKADTQGSVEVLRDSLSNLSTDETQVRIIHTGSGAISDSDVFLAVASNAIILGFNVSIESGAKRLADADGVEIRLYSLIYHLLEDIANALQGLVEPTMQDMVEGHATVRAIFGRGRQTKIAGVYVTDGRVLRNASARVLRDGQVVYDGQITSLRHFKDDVREMSTGLECGIGLARFNDFQEDDVLEIHRLQEAQS